MITGVEKGVVLVKRVGLECSSARELTMQTFFKAAQNDNRWSMCYGDHCGNIEYS